MYKTLMKVPSNQARCRGQLTGHSRPMEVRPYITFPPQLPNSVDPNSLLGVGDALERSLGSLNDLLNGTGVLLGLALSGVKGGLVLLAGVVEEDTSGLGGANAEEEEVDGGEEQVARLDDEAPTSPDQTSGSKSSVLGERKVLCGTSKVGGTGEDETPLSRSIVSNRTSRLNCAVFL